MHTLLDVLRRTEQYFTTHNIDSPRVDAELIIAHVLRLQRIDLYVQFDRPLHDNELSQIRPMIRRRATGEPVQYITGVAGFYSIELDVGPGVLIPRPETERVVDTALSRYTGTGPILDLCTGSGAIALAIAVERPQAPSIVGVDCSTAALQWAEQNRAKIIDGRCSTERAEVKFVNGDLFAPVAGQQFEVITANPPYVTASEFAALSPCVRDYEPRLALVAENNGLATLARIAEAGQQFLTPGGWLVCEIGAHQGDAASGLLQQHGWECVEIVSDYNDRDRVAIGQKQVRPL